MLMVLQRLPQPMGEGLSICSRAGQIDLCTTFHVAVTLQELRELSPRRMSSFLTELAHLVGAGLGPRFDWNRVDFFQASCDDAT